MYPYPAYPAYPPPYAPPPAPRTARSPVGLRWTVVALGFFIGYFAATALFAVGLSLFLAGPAPTTLAEVSSFAVLALASGAVTAILGILALVFYVIAFSFLYAGRNEFGPAHARNMRIAVVLLILALSVGFAMVIASWLISGTALQFVNGGWRANYGMFYVAVVVNAALGIVVAAFVAAHLVVTVRALSKPSHGPVLYVAAAIGTATPGIVGALALLQLPRMFAFIDAILEQQQGGPMFSLPSLDPGSGIPGIAAGALSAVTFALFLWVYWGAGARVRMGELKPVVPPPAPAVAYAPPMVPAYPYPYYQYPYPTAPPPVPPAPPTPPATPPNP